MEHKSAPRMPKAVGQSPCFNVSLSPYRSLGGKGFVWLMLAVSVLMTFATLPFVVLGAWPVVGFAGLDVLLLFWAFRRSYRDARAREEILITHDRVSFMRMPPRGELQVIDFNPYWVRLDSQFEEDKGMTRLAFRSHGREAEIGSFLHACERESLAKALQSALGQAKAAALPKESAAQVSGG